MFENIRSENKDILKVLATAVIKRQKEQDLYDTEDMKTNFQKYKEAHYKQDDVYAHTYSVEEYNAVGVTDIETIRLINADIRSMSYHIPREQMDLLLENKRKVIIDSYKEENRYVLILMGQPLSDDEVLYMEEYVEGVPMDKPLHEMTDSEIQVLESKGYLEKIIDRFPDYEYLRHLSRRVSFLTTRLAPAFSILYANTNTYSVAYQVIERYDKIRISFMRGMYNEFYHNSFAMYESIMSSYLISSTIFSIIAENPMNAVEFDFTSEDVLEAIYNTFSIPYMKDLPKSIKISLAERINKILMNKGSKSSIIDITTAFGIKDIYQYVLYKEYADAKVGYNPELTPEENYNLSFVRVPIDASDIHKYIYSNNADKIPYEEFVRTDARWGNGDDNLQRYILEHDFSYLPTKYVGIDSVIDLVKNIYNLSHFNSFLFDNKKRMGDYRITLQRSNITASLWEAFIYCVILIMNKNGYEDVIMKDPESLLYIEGINTSYCIDNNIVELYKKKLPTKLHYLLDYQSVDGTMPITAFMNIALHNRNCVNALRDIINEWTGDFVDYDHLCKLYRTVSKMTLNSYYGDMKEHNTYSEYLTTTNPTLHTHLELLRIDDNMETEMTDELVSVLDDLTAYLNPSNNSSIDDFLSFIDKKKTDEMNTLRILMFNMIAFLKSYTIDTKENNTVYLMYDYLKILEGTIERYKIREFSRLHVDESLSVKVHKSQFSSFMNVCDMVRRKEGFSSVYLGKEVTKVNELEYIRPDYHFKVDESLNCTHQRVYENDSTTDIHESFMVNWSVYESDIAYTIHETLITNYYSQLEHSFLNILGSLKIHNNIKESSTMIIEESLDRLSPYNWYSSALKIQDSFRRLDDNKLQTDI